MGVEYMHYVIPRRPSFRPSAERIARFAERLREERWVLGRGDPAFATLVTSGNFGSGGLYGNARRTGAMFRTDTEKGPAPLPLRPEWLRARKAMLHVEWPLQCIAEIGVRYPLTRWPYVRESMYFTIEIHWSQYFLPVYGSSGGSPEARCPCGADLALHPEIRLSLLTSAILTKCRSCGAKFDPSSLALNIKDSGQPVRVPGGGYHRFAVVIDCGKSIPEESGPICAHPDLLRTITEHFGCDVVDFGCVY